MTNSESPGIIEGPWEPKSQIYIMPQIMLTASKTPQCGGSLIDKCSANYTWQAQNIFDT